MNVYRIISLVLFLLSASVAAAQDAKLVFHDDFNRNESQETKDEPGNDWKTNSQKRAAGNKQVDLKDGAMYIYRHEVADHGVSVVHEAPFRDGKLEIRFMLENEKDTLGLNFADLKYKKVHAGHLFKVTIGTRRTELTDLKTGVMDLEIRNARKAKQLSKTQQAMLKTKKKVFKHKLETGKWYSAVVMVNGKKLSLSIDGEQVGSFSSPGIAHPTKRMIRLAVNKQAVVDDLKIWSVSRDPLKVLLIAGGCCHDYKNQTDILKQGIESRIRADVTVIYNPNTRMDARFKIYESDDWAEGYDVIVHDECSPDVSDRAYVQRVLAAHRNGTPAVNLHCSVHSYRWGSYREPVNIGDDNASWYEMLGVQSSHHDHHSPIDISFDKQQKDNPLIVGMKDWTTANEELYNTIRVFDGTNVLASGRQTRKDGKLWSAAVVWTNEFGPNKTRIFTTSLGHYNETVKDDRYMELVVRGLLWTTGNLTEDGKPPESLAVQR